MDKSEFLRKAEITHGNKYSYNEVNYVSPYEKVTIGCPDHGMFEQKPYAHMRGAVCPKCSALKKANLLKLPIDRFIEKARKLHGNLYNYSQVQYLNNRDFIDIECPKHGMFQQRVSAHLQGYGCCDCANEKRKYSTEEFIRRSNLVHNNKYDYSNVSYTHSKTSVRIRCPKHGEFSQIPNMHLLGSGCPLCSNNVRRLTQEEFISKCKFVHNEKYDYSKVVYVGCREKVVITCKNHGDFSQIPNSHLNGSGCPYCNASKGERAIENILEQKGIKYIREYKLPEIVERFEYDFYLPDRNILIEFQGIQHYKSIPYFGGEDALAYTKRNDRFKRDFARLFKYRLVELNYKQLKFLSTKEFEELVLNIIDNCN